MLLFRGATAALRVAAVIMILMDGFSGTFAVCTILVVLGIGLTADLGRQWRKAPTRDRSHGPDRTPDGTR